MSFFKNESGVLFESVTDDGICFACMLEITDDQPIVAYDGAISTQKGSGRSLILHIECANIMAQRLIIDSWSNRDKSLKNPFKK